MSTTGGTPADQLRARQRHRQRYRDQIWGWGGKIVLAAASVPLIDFIVRRYSVCSDAPLGSVGCSLGTLSLSVPSLLLAGLLIGNWRFHSNRFIDWELAISNAQQFANTQIVTKGFTELFSIYVRTKRRSYHVMAWGLLAIAYAGIGAVGGLANLKIGAAALVYGTLQIIELGLGIALLALAYRLGSEYLPGDVIVRHTLALLIRATSNATDQAELKRQAIEEAEPFVHSNPWWFFAG